MLQGTPTCHINTQKYVVGIYDEDNVNVHNVSLTITIIGRILEFYYPVSEIIDCPSTGLITLNPIVDCDNVIFSLELPSTNDYNYTISVNRDTGELKILYPTKDITTDFSIDIIITASTELPSSKVYMLKITFSVSDYFKGFKYIIDTVVQTVQCPDRFYVQMDRYEGIKESELNFFDNVNNFTEVFPNVLDTYSNFIMNITGYINIKNKETVTFYSRSNYMSTVAVDDKYVIFNFIERDGNESFCTNYSVLHKGSIELDVGFHKYELFTMSNKDKEDEFPFDFSYSENSGSIVPIDSYYKGKFETVDDFYITSTDYTFTVDQIVSVPFLVKNAVSCTSEPSLPEGLEIRLEELEIKGKALKKSERTSYSFLCRNLFAVSNKIILNIEVVDILKQGLIAYYLKPTNTEEIEMNSYFEIAHTLENDKHNLITKIIRHESFINNQFNIDAKPWLGLSSDFSTKYNVEWKGLMYFDTVGRWSAELNCKDACFLYINKVLAGYVRGLNEVNVTRTGEFSIKEIGYYNFTFNLLVNEGGSGDVLRMRKPGSDNHEYIDNILYYIPMNNNLIQYNYTLVTYNTNVTIEENNPIINTDKTIKEFTIKPELPNGLVLNINGSITGKPTKSSELDVYTIITSFNDGSESILNEIAIGVEDIEQLSEVYLYNNLTHEKIDKNSPPVFPIGVYVELIIKIDGGYPYNFGCSGLPNGLVYHANTKVIEGYPTEIGAYFLNIYAISLVERVNTMYTISVAHSCKIGYHMTTFSFLLNDAEYQAYLQDKRGNEIFTIYSLPKPNWIYQLCLKEDEYKLILYMSKFQEGKGFYYKILVDGLTYYDDDIYSDKNIDSTMEFSFSTVMSPPTISYSSSEYELETFSTLKIKPTVTNHPTFFNITPTEIVKDLFFDNKTGIFEGASVDYFDDIEYTVIAENPYGKSEPFTVKFKSTENQCEENGKAILHLFGYTKLARTKYMFLEIKDKNNKVILSVDGSKLDDDKNYDYYRCIPQGDYKVTYGTTHINKLGWKSGYFDIYLDKISLGHYAMPLPSYEMSEITTTVHFVYDIDINSKWEYKIRVEGEEDWNLPSSTTKWQETLLSNLPEIKGHELYLRKRITISDIKDYSSYATKLDISSEFVFYMNGKEIFRHLGVLDGNRKKDYYQFLFPIHKLEDGQFMVAIELHRIASAAAASLVFPYFRFVSFGIIGDESECSELNYFGGNVVDEHPKPKTVGGAINAFLIDGENSWTMSGMQLFKDIWVIYSFGRNTYVPVNQFYIIAGNTAKYYFPKNVTIEILTPDGEWIEYAREEDLNLQNPFEARSIKVINSDLQINQIKFTLHINNRRFSIAGLRMVNCQFYTCPKTDYLPETITDSIVEADCIDDPNGYRVFQCPFGKDPEWKEIENYCESKPILLNAVKNHSFVVGNTEKPFELFSISGNVKNVTVTPDLPECIINTKIGVYYSNCVYIVKKCDYMFIVENDIGYINFTINIDVIGTMKPVIIESLSSYTFYADLYIDIAYLFQIVGSDLEFSVEPELPSGIKLNKNVGYIYGKTSSCFIASTFLFTCVNQYGSVKISVELNCTSNQEPVVVEIKKDYDFYTTVNYSNYSLFTVAGRNLSYSIEPELPKSLVLDSKTGYINGEITLDDVEKKRRYLSSSSLMEDNYTVSVSNENGIESKNITVSFQKPTIPTIISDSKKIRIPENEMINNYKILEIAGEVTSYEIDPPLPSGITFNKNGEISGIPLHTVGNRMYKFTLENSQGSNSVSMFLSFNVPEQPIIYDQEDSLTFYKTIEINSTKLVTATGKEIMNYRIEPHLPNGISFSSSTAVISGTPTVESELTNYTIFIKNQKGEIFTNVSLKVVIKTCESDDIWPSTEMGKEYKIKCGGLHRGSKTRVCKRNNNDAIWESVNEDCYIPIGFIILFSLLALVAVIVVVIICVYFYYSYQKKKRTVKPSAEAKFSDI